MQHPTQLNDMFNFLCLFTFQESIITKLFGGQLRSEYKIRGDRLSITLEPFQFLSLDIPKGSKSLMDCLKGYMELERVNDRSDGRTSTKKVTLHKLPHTLIFYLKRFTYNKTLGQSKIGE